MTTLNNLVDPWLLEEDSDDLIRLRDQLVWLRRHLFGVYEPSLFRSFEDRLVGWLQNVPDGPDRRTMFRLLRHLFFVGRPQFYALCMGAFNDAIVRWLIEQEGIDIAAADISERLLEATRHTWFCPVTDSMDINAFLKVNRLSGHDIRGDWRSFELLGDQDAIREHVTEQGITRIVFLEDFVGSGDQLRGTILFARDTLPSIPILLVPLICCPEGARTGNLLAGRPNVTFAPVLSLPEQLFVTSNPLPDEPSDFAEVRALIERIKHRLGDWESEPYGHADTGALVAMHSNCPDNTLPIIHEANNDWAALFPRVPRE